MNISETALSWTKSFLTAFQAKTKKTCYNYAKSLQKSITEDKMNKLKRVSLIVNIQDVLVS